MKVEDSQWMAKAMHLAERGLCTTSPNPRVGCVLVRHGSVVGEGWHVRAGESHAEVHALLEAKEMAKGATAYVTLEPCNHFGRTPPCTDALIDAGVARVVISMQDPNPLVAGRGIAKLRGAGIKVDIGLMETIARELNIGFYSRMTRGTPWIRSKIAASIDGRTGLANGNSKWITGEKSRQDVQRLRARSCAVLTGIGTVLADDPQLNIRMFATERQPLRVVLDSELRISPQARILQDGQTLIFTVCTDDKKIQMLNALGAEVVNLTDLHGKVDLTRVLRELGQRGINEVLVEAGRTLNGALIQAGLIDEFVLYLAPQLLGDAALGMAKLGMLTQLQQRVDLQWNDVRQVGTDLRVVARLLKEK